MNLCQIGMGTQPIRSCQTKHSVLSQFGWCRTTRHVAGLQACPGNALYGSTALKLNKLIYCSTIKNGSTHLSRSKWGQCCSFVRQPWSSMQTWEDIYGPWFVRIKSSSWRYPGWKILWSLSFPPWIDLVDEGWVLPVVLVVTLVFSVGLILAVFYYVKHRKLMFIPTSIWTFLLHADLHLISL